MRKEVKIVLAVLAIIIVLILAFIFSNPIKKPMDKINNTLNTPSCTQDSDCVPSSCCHASSCVAKSSTPDCADKFCTQVCQPGTLDCGQASCGCVNNQCQMELK